MRFKQVGNKRDGIAVVIKNAETTNAIPRGTPVILIANGTDDGLGVVLPSTAGNAKSGTFRYGVAADTYAAGTYGESFVFGYCPYALVTTATRAATTDSWTSSQSIATAVQLAIDTLNNAFVVGASQAGTISGVGFAAIANTISSMAASASATSDTRTAIVQGAGVFVRMM